MLPTITPPPATAPLPTPTTLADLDLKILVSLISAGGTLWDLADNYGLTIPALFAKITSPEFQAALAAYQRVLELASACHTICSRTEAVNALLAVAATSQSPAPERRRAATEILRAERALRTPAPHPSHAPRPSRAAADDDRAEHPTPADTPSSAASDSAPSPPGRGRVRAPCLSSPLSPDADHASPPSPAPLPSAHHAGDPTHPGSTPPGGATHDGEEDQDHQEARDQENRQKDRRPLEEEGRQGGPEAQARQEVPLPRRQSRQRAPG